MTDRRGRAINLARHGRRILTDGRARGLFSREESPRGTRQVPSCQVSIVFSQLCSTEVKYRRRQNRGAAGTKKDLRHPYFFASIQPGDLEYGVRMLLLFLLLTTTMLVMMAVMMEIVMIIHHSLALAE